MLFSSITFLTAFLPVVLLIYYFCPSTGTRNYFLLFSSLLFYAWGEPVYVFIMVLSICFNYKMGLFIASGSIDEKTGKIILGAAITGNLLVLVYFKYFGFFAGLINLACPWLQIPEYTKNILMPIGISFYTFQSISYLVDVYKNRGLVQKNILNLGLFITFFPQLIAGPIVRYNDICGQIKERPHSLELFTDGVVRFIVGLSKKVLLANVFAETADGVLAMPFDSVPSYYLWVAILSYTMQIYYDFSGYSDMAIGLGRMFGFRILENFNYPYVSRSITEFWRRWHISLSGWFKDYLYIPLGGNRKGKARTIINLVIVFSITGLWHGAALNFMFWGLGHGVLLLIEKLLGKYVPPVLKRGLWGNVVSRIYVMAGVVFLWMFFRLSIKEGVFFISNLFRFNANIQKDMELFILVDIRFYLFFIIGILFSFPWWRKVKTSVYNAAFSGWLPAMGKYIVSLSLLILSVCSLANSSYNPFIYFRF
jgi:alginate O-acetyltransferase complex protein AlgI